MARVCAAGYDDLSPDSDDDSPRLTKDPRSAACGAEVSPLKPVMPRVLTTVSSMVKHPETSTWHVRMGDDVPKFLYANGPARIVLYNYNVVKEMVHKELVVRRSAGPKQGYSDIFELSPASRVTSTRRVTQWCGVSSSRARALRSTASRRQIVSARAAQALACAMRGARAAAATAAV